jgi:hypothetical protein
VARRQASGFLDEAIGLGRFDAGAGQVAQQLAPGADAEPERFGGLGGVGEQADGGAPPTLCLAQVGAQRPDGGLIVPAGGVKMLPGRLVVAGHQSGPLVEAVGIEGDDGLRDSGVEPSPGGA